MTNKNKERKKEYNRKWYQKNKERIRKCHRRYSQKWYKDMSKKNKEKKRELAREHYRKNKEKAKEYSKKYSKNVLAPKRKVLKKKAVDFLGGKCSKCGYNKCMAALDFHHKQKRENHHKENDISVMITALKHWEVIKKELKKCILLCANCHRELHEAEKK